jgi:hypothetical protein
MPIQANDSKNSNSSLLSGLRSLSNTKRNNTNNSIKIKSNSTILNNHSENPPSPSPPSSSISKRSINKNSHSNSEKIISNNETRSIISSNDESSSSIHSLIKIKNSSSSLKTKNPIKKRHSVFISSSISNNDTNINTISSLDPKNFNSNTILKSKSIVSLNDLSIDQIDPNSTVDSMTILNNLDNNNNYNNTINNAFLDYNVNLNNLISSNPSENANLIHINTDDDSDTDTDTDTGIDIDIDIDLNINFKKDNNTFTSLHNQKPHPLKKLIINSPNTSSHSFSSNNKNSNQLLKYKPNLLPTSTSPSPTPTTSPYRKLIIPQNNHIKKNIKTNLVLFEPKLKDSSPEITIISNCIFFGNFSKQFQSPSKPSQTLATDVFIDINIEDSPIKNKKNCIQISNLTSGLVDPDLFSKSAGSVFLAPSSLPSKNRTSLYFV